jgi:hypothetical protein
MPLPKKNNIPSRTILWKMVGEDYARFMRVAKKKGIFEAKTLFRHLLAEADPGEENGIKKKENNI